MDKIGLRLVQVVGPYRGLSPPQHLISSHCTLRAMSRGGLCVCLDDALRSNTVQVDQQYLR